jgi:uncharacterized membrane protein (DUF106 family)
MKERDKKGKLKGGTIGLLFVLAISFYIGIYWEKLDAVRAAVGFVLDPTFGVLIEWNTFIGFLITVAVISLILTIAQKFFTDQAELKILKAEQKAVQEEMKQYKNHPEKLIELQKKSFSTMPKMMHLTMRAFVYTGVPIILFFRWFQEMLAPIYGGWWILYYLIGAMIFSIIFRKIFKVV